MGLSSELIDQLVKVTQNTEPRDKDNTAYGTVVVMGSKKYVKIDGSDLMTPVSSTVAVENGDRVIVTIKNHSATVTGNTTSPAASDKKVTELGTKISDFEIVIADKVSAKELDVQIGRIDDLTADNATIKETLTANKASIDDLTAKNAEITGTLEANKAKIDDLDAKKLDADIADIKYASVDRLDATDANLRNLKSDYAQFEKTTTGELEATNAKIDGLDTKYANVDFSNIGKAAIERFYATSGIIKDLVVGDQTITGELVGITISGDLIKGNTIVADKLVVKGSDGLYYKLNTDGVTTEKEQTEYNSLNGQIIQAKSITATKIDVKDLVAFGATIGGFDIGQNSIFSGVKESVDNNSRGIYMDKNGQIAIGDVNNYIKYFKDTDGRYRLKISADSLEFNASGDGGEESKDLETVIKDINNRVNGIAETNKGIGSITNYYLATSASSGVTTETAGWTTKIQNVSSSKKYLWNYEVTKYTDDTVANTTEPCIIGMYSAVGATGNGIQKITEYYALSALKDSVPTVWSENVPNLTATNKYLWNYEEILYTNGGTELTKKRVIGVYGDTGKDGAKGEKGDTGAKGVGVSNVDVMYYKSTSATSLSGGSWVTTDPGWENGKYIWSKTIITYTDKTTDESTPVCITGAKGSTGGTGAKGETGATGKGVSSIVEQYYQSTSATTLTGGSWSEEYPGWVNGKYIWTRSVITYTDKTSTTTTAVCVTGAKGSTGNNGKSIGSVINYYLATASSSGVKTSTSGWTTTVQNVTLDKKYLWNYEVVKYSDGTVASTTSPCIIGTYGDTGKTGATGADGKGIKSTVITYQASTSGTTIPTGTWQTGIPTVSAGQYLWTRTVITYTDDSKSTSYSVGRMGTNGSAGRGIKSTAITYQAGSSGTTAPTGTWQTSVPATSASSPYLWTRTIINYTDDTTSTSYAVGSTLEGVSVGGRNLLPKTHKTAVTYMYPTGTSFSDNFGVVSTVPLNGDTYTLSFWAKSTVNGDKIIVHFWNPSNIISGKSSQGITIGASDGRCPFTLSTTLTKYWVTYKIPAGGNSTRNVIIPRLYGSDRTETEKGTGKITVQWEKLEEGNIATDWTPAPEDGIASVDVEYYLSTSATALSGGSWSTAAPTWVNGKYMWSRTVTVNGAGNKTYSPNQNGVCIAGAKGETGNTALTFKKNFTGTYTTAGTETNAMLTSFNRTPVIGDIFTNIDGSSNTGTWEITKIENDRAYFKLLSYVSSKGATGATGATGKGVTSIVEQYYKSTSATALSGGSWGTTYPGWENGKYIWTRSVITYTDKTTTTTTAVCVTGTKGSTGNDGKTSYVHMAYANITYICAENSSFTLTSATLCRYGKNDKWVYKTLGAGTYTANTTLFGSDPANGVVKEVNKITGFSITDSSGRAYMGQYTDFEQAGSNDVSKYVWTKVQGAKGDTGDKGETGATGPQGPTGPKGESDIKCYPLTGGDNQFVWSKLGTLTSAGDDSNFIINVYTGNGFNGGANQNSQAEIVIKDGWQSSASTTSAFGVSVTRQNCDNLKVQVRATASNKCDVWVYLPWSYGHGTYTISGKYTSWSPSNTTQTAEPTTGTLQDIAYRMNSENAAKTATNFMEFTSGTGLQIGDKTNGTWKGFRSRITSTAFEILNEAGAAVASYGRKLIQLGKDSTDAVIELCGGKGTIKYENVWLYGGEDDTLTINAENMAILSDKNIVIRAKRVTADNIRITNQLFMSDDSIHITMYEMNADLPDEADDCVAGIDIDKKSGINLETLGVTDKALTGVSINGRSLLNHIYPVGSIYMSTNATNPSNFFGGTWVAWGAGRVPVGFNSGDANFNSSEKTGGSKTINISHSHTVNSHKHVGATGYDENNYYSGVQWGSIVLPSYGYWWHARESGATNPIRLSYTSPESPGTNSQLSGSQSILQPYITCYMWKRTA